MEEPTPDMLPDQSQTEPVVTPAVKETVSEDVKPPVADAGPTEDAPAESTPSGFIPYSRFKEVNKELKETKEKLKSLEASSTPEEEVESETHDMGVIQQELRELRMDKYLTQFPELNDKREELDEYLESNSDLSLERAVNLFRVEAGLIGSTPARKGLEKVVAGPKTAPTPRWSLEQIDELRQTDEKRWQKLMNEGAFEEALKGW